ncbi:hypothetical protein MNEG_1203, partial [Monoraphidium neglectum]
MRGVHSVFAVVLLLWAQQASPLRLPGADDVRRWLRPRVGSADAPNAPLPAGALISAKSAVVVGLKASSGNAGGSIDAVATVFNAGALASVRTAARQHAARDWPEQQQLKQEQEGQQRKGKQAGPHEQRLGFTGWSLGGRTPADDAASAFDPYRAH